MTCTHFVHGQEFSAEEQRQIDSLNSVISRPKHDTALASAYVNMSKILGRSDWDTVLVLCNKAVEIAENGLETKNTGKEASAYKRVLIRAYTNIGFVNNFRGNNDVALEYNQRSVSIAEELGDKNALPTTYLNIGAIYYDMGDIPTALDYFSKSARISEELNDIDGMAYAYNNIGSVHQEQKDYKLALPYFEKTREICAQINDLPGLAMAYDNIAQVRMNQDAADTTALWYYTEALKLRESINDHEGIASSFINLSTVYERYGDLSKAEDLLKKALDIQVEIGDRQGEGMSCTHIAVIALKKGPNSLKDAIIYGKRGLSIAEELGDPHDMSSAAITLSEAYQTTGNFREAFEMYRLHVAMRDSVYNAENKREAMRQHMQYEYDKKEALLAAEQEKKDALAKEQLQRRGLYLAAAAGITFLLSIISFILYLFYRSRTKANAALEKKNIEVQQQKAVVDARNHEIMQSFNYARRLQEAVMPGEAALKNHFSDSFLLYRPRDVVSGDFYWTANRNGIIYLAVGDCTGHGVPGAMLSVIGLNSLNRCISDLGLTRPKDVLMQMTIDLLITFEAADAQVRDGMDIALCAIDTRTNTLTYSGANNPLWVARQGEMLVFKADRRAVGYHDGETVFTQQEVALQLGDAIYLMSDGFQDQLGGPDDRKFMTKKLRETLQSISHLPMAEQHTTLDRAFTEWRGNREQTDDVCVVGVKLG
jgi:serine phosphatase RsbU (regulator of sigma subunit)